VTSSDLRQNIFEIPGDISLADFRVTCLNVLKMAHAFLDTKFTVGLIIDKISGTP
jgi:hypothetical protein